MYTLARRFSLATMIGMFLIIMMGALVTKTDSGLGCGYEWPLCNGKFVPAYTISSMIEYSHRAVTGLVGFLMLATFILVFKSVERKDAKYFVGGAALFTVIQAAMGAFAVVWPQSSAVLALHFGLSLLAFAMTLLLWLTFTKWGDYTVSVARETRQGQSAVQPGSAPVAPGFRKFVWFIAVYCYIVVYVGAFVRHTESSGGCAGWPLCNGEVVPTLSGASGIVFFHRLAAAGILICGIVLFVMARKNYSHLTNVYNGTRWVLILLVAQVFSGALVTWSLGHETLFLFTAMIHAVLICALFGFISYLCVVMLSARKPIEKNTAGK
ncbi:COX15/CtaA family protein [Paenibacillus lutrae]|uniref:Heme A synthase n=1 Tax=Paenibacillus lutrae TaxID=2078573 RepID=A0A7X3FL48_9BACL|nr:COX15/CtaA family protein [Paenibacillus lutrae]MVP01739.1 heme A synthase [Paenibacillus lutrae]